MKSTVTSLVICIGLVLQAAYSSSQNLIQNGGFETATYVGWPSGNSLSAYPTFTNSWAAVDVDGEMMFSDSLAHTGTGFLSVLQNAGANPVVNWLGNSAGGGFDRAIQLIPVTPSTTYYLSFYMESGNSLRYSGYGSGTTFIQVEQFSPAAVIDTFMQYTPLTWQQFSYTFITGASCDSIALLFSIVGPAGADAWIDDVELTAQKGSGVNGAETQSEVTIFPTLFTNRLTVQNNPGDESLITIYDAVSKKVVQQNFSGTLSINTQHFASGIYFYEIKKSSGEVLMKGKLVKQ
jgi:hypothetical protein